MFAQWKASIEGGVSPLLGGVEKTLTDDGVQIAARQTRQRMLERYVTDINVT